MPFIDHNGKRVLYVHVPKTGGTSIERWLATLAPLRLHSVGLPAPLRVTPQHLRHADIEALLGAGAFDYAFMTVRNPFSRIESEYRMQASLAEAGLWQAAPQFGPWLERALERLARDPHADDNHLRPQWEFLGDGVEVFRLEDGLERPLAAAARALGVAPPAVPAHALRGAARPIRWRRPDILRLLRAHAQDFDEFGYDREAPPAA